MDVDRIFAQYQKYIAIAERMRLRSSQAQEAELTEMADGLPWLDLPASDLQSDRQKIWRPVDHQEAVVRLRATRN